MTRSEIRKNLATCASALAVVLATASIVQAQNDSKIRERAAVGVGAALPASALTRLKAAGLDPAAAGFHDQIRARLKQPFAAAIPVFRERFTAIRSVPAPLSVASWSKVSRATAVHKSQIGTSASSNVNGSHSDGVYQHTTTNIGSGGAAALLAHPFVWDGLTKPPSLERVTSIYEPASFQAFLTGDPPAYAADVIFAVPECSATARMPGKVIIGAGSVFAVTFPANDKFSFLPIGAAARNGTVSISINGRTSDNLPMEFLPINDVVALPLTIDSTPPFVINNMLGIGAGNATFARPTIERLNLGSQEISGDDYLGQKIATGAGYTVTASIVAARSVSDIGDTSPDNAYRGATISVQPGSNRLETVVHWHIRPGESLQYQVRWEAKGPVGQRPISSMPKSGPCDT